jgi:hypothetical protein
MTRRRVTIPERVDARWIETLDDDQLMVAEARLHAVFHAAEASEKHRSGSRYMLLEGPQALVHAWHRWLLVSNETRSRGLVVHRGR